MAIPGMGWGGHQTGGDMPAPHGVPACPQGSATHTMLPGCVWGGSVNPPGTRVKEGGGGGEEKNKEERKDRHQRQVLCSADEQIYLHFIFFAAEVGVLGREGGGAGLTLCLPGGSPRQGGGDTREVGWWQARTGAKAQPGAPGGHRSSPQPGGVLAPPAANGGSSSPAGWVGKALALISLFKFWDDTNNPNTLQQRSIIF